MLDSICFRKRKNWKSRGIMNIFKYFVCTMFSKSLWNRRAFFYSQMTSLENFKLPNKGTCLLNLHRYIKLTWILRWISNICRKSQVNVCVAWYVEKYLYSLSFWIKIQNHKGSWPRCAMVFFYELPRRFSLFAAQKDIQVGKQR